MMRRRRLIMLIFVAAVVQKEGDWRHVYCYFFGCNMGTPSLTVKRKEGHCGFIKVKTVEFLVKI